MSLKRLISRDLYKLKNVLPKPFETKRRNQHNPSESQRYFDMPEHYYNSYYFANATINENLLWYVGNTLEKNFQQLVTNYSKNLGIEKEDAIEREIKNLFKNLEFCRNIYEVHYPIRKKDGNYEVIRGFCMHHGDFYPVHLGGIRIDENLDKTQLKTLATLSTYKHFLADAPYVGAFCGIKINAGDYCNEDLQQIIQKFVASMARSKCVGPDICCFEPEVNCNEDIMREFSEAMKISLGTVYHQEPCCLVGTKKKDIENFFRFLTLAIVNSVNRIVNEKKIMDKINCPMGLEGKKYILKGFGQMGVLVSDYLSKMGARCIGIIEKDYGYYNPQGLKIDEFIKYKEQHGHIRDYCVTTEYKKLLGQPCDILVICSTHKDITYFNAPDIKASVIIEVASSSITPAAQKVLMGKNKLVIPDIYLNAISSILSNLELEQTRKDENLLPSKVSAAGGIPVAITGPAKNVQHVVKERMDFISENIFKILEDYNLEIDLRSAAYVSAMDNIIQKFVLPVI